VGRANLMKKRHRREVWRDVEASQDSPVGAKAPDYGFDPLAYAFHWLGKTHAFGCMSVFFAAARVSPCVPACLSSLHKVERSQSPPYTVDPRCVYSQGLETLRGSC
jgi:hypothetical protein